LTLTTAVAVPEVVHAQPDKVNDTDIEVLENKDQGLSSLETVGCFNYGYRYHPAMEVPGRTQPFKERTAMHCQAWCKAVPGCKNFAYWLGTQECWLGAADSKLVMAKSFGAVSGPVTCPEQPAPACTEIPSFLFPAQSRQQTQEAWESGYQPTNLQCWPRKASGFPENCTSKEVQILEDTENGWPGQCEGMKLTDLDPGECQLRCFHNPLCAVWQTMPGTSGTRCFHGMFGTNCYRTNGLQPYRAQRLMHGDFRVLANIAGIQIMGLQQAFEANVFTNLKDAENHCRMVCVSYLLCQYWQYSEVFGCWIEDVVKKRVAYPLVNDGVNLQTDSAGAKTVTAGEFIQHMCKKGPHVPLPTDEPTMTVTTTTIPETLPPTPRPTAYVPPVPKTGFVQTRTIEPVLSGYDEVKVQSIEGLNKGDFLRLTYDEGVDQSRAESEGAVVRSLHEPDTIVFTHPLRRGYPKHTLVTMQANGACYDTNFDGTDVHGEDCSRYADFNSICGDNDDEDFTARDMCCSCMGGSPVPVTKPPPITTTATPKTTTQGRAVRRPTDWDTASMGGLGGSQSLSANQAQEVVTLILLCLTIVFCIGCIITAWTVAFQRRKYNKTHGRELHYTGQYTSGEHADQSLVHSDAHSFYGAQGGADAAHDQGSPQAYQHAAVPTQVMQPGYGQPGYGQMQQGFGHMQQGYGPSPYEPQGPQVPFPTQRLSEGGPIGGQNQYYAPF
jgi:hypothetical protein